MVWERILQEALDKNPSSGKEKQSRFIVDNSDRSSQKPIAQRKRKRDDFNPIDKSDRREKKQMRINMKSMEQNVDSVDRISQLPEHIIHQILASVRCKKDAARTSILSKRWREIWASFSNLVFDQRKFHTQERNLQGVSDSQEIKRKIEAFRNYVDNTLQSRIQQKVSIQKFMLHVTYYNQELAANVDRWIDAAIERNIQDLDLHLPAKKRRCYNLPQRVFATKTITALRVYGCKLGTCDDIKLSHLQKLCLGKLHIDEQIIRNLICICPLIEDFRLINCSGLKTLLVSDVPNLKRVDLHLCRGLKKVELLAPNLEIFWYHGRKSLPCKINLSECKSLKSLSLEDANLKDELIQTHLSNFPLLEKLALSKCNVKNITISGFRMKTLIFRDCRKLIEADIDTPNLLSLEYKGCIMPFSSFNPSGLKEAKLYFEPPKEKAKAGFWHEEDDQIWLAGLQEFLSKFDYSKGLKLVARFKKNIIIYEESNEILLPPVYGLKLEIVKSFLGFEDLLDNVLRTWHPETLSIISSSSSSFFKIARKKLVTREEEEPSCCRYNTVSNKCWRHFLEHSKVESLSSTRATSTWIGWLRITSTKMPQTTCFRLNWKSHKSLMHA
ncbi:hypothetical protein SLE2022_309580 [Rubroshorea leprosula]